MPFINPEIVTTPSVTTPGDPQPHSINFDTIPHIHGGKLTLSPLAPTVATTPGDPPPPHYINADNVPLVNGVIQTSLPHMPAGYSYR
jgi:hypothetical protein